MKNKKTYNDLILTLISLSMLINLIVPMFILSIASVNTSIYRMEAIIRDMQDPTYRIILYACTIISMAGLSAAVGFFLHISRLDKISIAENELQEQKEKYRLATEELVKLMKSKII